MLTLAKSLPETILPNTANAPNNSANKTVIASTAPVKRAGSTIANAITEAAIKATAIAILRMILALICC